MRRVLLLLALLTAALGIGALGAGVASAQSGCLPAGGAKIPAAKPAAGDFVFTGTGWGHGVGMSQAGARGAARLGCSATQILQTYYPGVSVAATTMPSNIRVGLYPDRPATSGGQRASELRVEAVSDAVAWRLRRGNGTTASLPTQPKGKTWTVRVQANDSFRVLDGSTQVWSGGDADATLEVRHDAKIIRLPQKGRRYRHGTLELSSPRNSTGLFAVADIPSMERYLYGLAEVPSSWETEALRAQAITGRSFALAQREQYPSGRSDCRCHLFDTVFSQHYTGYEKEAESNGPRWVAAVDATAGRTMRHNGRTAVGFYAASHGGHSESGQFVWGGATAYLQAIDDSRWELAGDHPHRTWSYGISAAALGAKFGVGTALKVETPSPRGVSGRIGDPARGAGGVVVTGTTGSKTVSGNTFRATLGNNELRSTNFTVTSQPAAPTCAAPTGAAFSPHIARVAGDNRVDTAARAATRYWDTSTAAVIGTAGDFPDALAGGALAADLGAPLLLTPRATLAPQARAALETLGVQRVTLLGGPAAISRGVADDLRAMGLAVTRLEGANRFDTAARVAAEVGAGAGGEVLLALGGHSNPGRGWPDAVAAAALNATDDRPPTLLTRGDTLPAETERALADLGARKVVIVGGTAAVGRAVEDRVKALGYQVSRLAGDNRYETSVAVADLALGRSGGARLVFATGTNYPDALSAGALAARRRAPVVLVPDCQLHPTVRSFVADRSTVLSSGVIVGGANAVSRRVEWELGTALGG